MTHLILLMPLWLSIMLFTMMSGGMVAITVIFIRKRVAHEKLKQNNEVAGFNYAVLGAVYSMLLAFMTVAIYDEYKDGRNAIQNEATAVGALYRMAGGYAEPGRSRIRGELVNYARSVMDDEWSRMETGQEHPRTLEIYGRIWEEFLGYKPDAGGEMSVHSLAFTMLGDFHTARHDRLTASRTVIPGLLWFVLAVGAAFTIAYTFFFSTFNINVQMLMTSMIAILISLILLLIVQLDNPFFGPISVSKLPLEKAYQEMTVRVRQ